MPRTARASQAGYSYHVLNRGNARSEVFHRPGDFSAFLQVISESSVRSPMGLLAYCLMPNHFHLVVRPHADGDLSRWMQWLLDTHVRRYVKYHGHSGHLWQGRLKAFPIEDDNHLVTVVRDVERNPLRRQSHFIEQVIEGSMKTKLQAWLAVPASRFYVMHIAGSFFAGG